MVVADASVIRAGKTSVVVDAGIYEVNENSAHQISTIGSAMMTFSRLIRRDDTPVLQADDNLNNKINFAIGGSGLTQSIIDKIGVIIINGAKGVIELKSSSYIRNSFNVVHGGMIAVLSDTAGQITAREATGRPMVTSDLTIHYLAQGKYGPFRTRAKILRITDDTVLTRIELIDRGADDRLISIAMNTSTLP